MAAGLLLVTPGVALGHVIGGRLDLPFPVEFFIVGAGLVLVASFVALALLWPESRFADGPHYDEPTRLSPPRPLLAALGLVGMLLVVGQMIRLVVVVDTDSIRPTIAPVTVWVLFWLVIPFSSVFIGNWYTDVNPWRTLAKLVGIGNTERPEVSSRLGVWPGVVLLVVFSWFELVSPNSGEPVTLGVVTLLFTALMLGVAAYSGRETGMMVFDPFTTYNRLFSAISPLGRDPEGRLVWRGWLRSLAVLPDWPGLWVFVVAMIATVSFDGATGTAWFANIAGGLLDSVVGQTVLLAGSVVLVGLGYWTACWLAGALSTPAVSPARVARRFAHTLVPIAVAFPVAHYLTLILFEGQQLISTLSDPFGLGWDLFGTADRRIDFFITSTDPIWYSQVASIVAGHVLAVVLAHDRALIDFGRDAVRPRYAMLVLMVALTTLGLVILAG